MAREEGVLFHLHPDSALFFSWGERVMNSASAPTECERTVSNQKRPPSGSANRLQLGLNNSLC
ncbi:hypothetical protein HI914_05679 [Erysiphe necator]|nr:hypothetical protein HI914_05679 [Erysiphe necator]